MIKIFMIFLPLFYYSPFFSIFMSFYMILTFYLMAFRAGTDSAVSFIIPTYEVHVSFYNIIYVERKDFIIEEIKKRFHILFLSTEYTPLLDSDFLGLRVSRVISSTDWWEYSDTGILLRLYVRDI